MKTIVIETIVISIGIAVFAAVVALIVSLPTMWLWNWLMPQIFGLPTVTWLQALGLVTLTGILFRSPSFSRKK